MNTGGKIRKIQAAAISLHFLLFLFFCQSWNQLDNIVDLLGLETVTLLQDWCVILCFGTEGCIVVE